MWGSRDPVLEFGDPLIYRERLKLETLNLARRWIAVSTNEENAKLGQKGSCGVTYPLLEFRDPSNISRTVKATNFKFGMQTDGSEL